MRGKPVTPSPAAVILSSYAKQIGTDPKALVSLGVQALAGQISREGELKFPHYLVHDCATCPIGQQKCSQAPANIIRFPQVGLRRLTCSKKVFLNLGGS